MRRSFPTITWHEYDKRTEPTGEVILVQNNYFTVHTCIINSYCHKAGHTSVKLTSVKLTS